MTRTLLLLVSLAALAAACAASEPEAQSVAEATSRIACGAALPGPALPPGSTEANPSFAAPDLAGVPDPLPLGADGLKRSVASYMLGRQGATTVTKADALAAGGLGKTVLAAHRTGGTLDMTVLRKGLYANYLCSRPIPERLDALVARYGDYKKWPSFDIECSRAKDGPRRFFEDEAQGVYVAETLSGGAVRETEVIFSHLRDDGQLDFAVYTADGHLSDRSTFAGEVVGAAPFTCMTCHFDGETRAITRRFPIGTGSGCSGP